MKITTENATPIFTITGMELEYYNAAIEGNIDAFKGKGGEEIESILTPNKNTILHVHFTNYTDSVSETFVEEVLGMCPVLLLKTNAKVETILHIAARLGHHRIVRKLIDRAKVLTRDIDGVGVEKRLIRALNDKKDTALHEAARYGHTEVVGVLIKEEPDLSYYGQNDGGETPLYIAIERQYWNVVDLILDNSHSTQCNGPNGRTALHAATIFGAKEIVSKLLMRDLLLAKQADENGWVPLHLAAIVDDYSELVELLVSKDRSTAYMRDNKGRTALHLAALYRNARMMAKILKYCPDCCELVDGKGCNALHYTAMDQASYVNWIAPRQEEEIWIAPLQEEEILKNEPLMRNMCNEKDDDGNTPLHYIARLASGRETNYDHALLKPKFKGVVDKMACNKYGQNPLDIAGTDKAPDFARKNKLYGKLLDIGATFGGRVMDKDVREKKQEKRHDPVVDEKEKENKTNGEEKEKEMETNGEEKEREMETNGENVLSEKATSLSVVAILIATVTFAAGFTLPGGLNQDKGFPILKYNAAFVAFVITDSLSFVLSTFVVLLLFSLSRVSKKIEWGKEFHVQLLRNCSLLTIVAMGFMIVAFGTGIYAVLRVSNGFGVVTLLIVLSFFFIVIILITMVTRRTDESILETFLLRKQIEKLEQETERARHHTRNYPLFRVRDIQLSDVV